MSAPWPPGDGEMSRRIRGYDWASTPLGPVEGWSPPLRIMVEQVLACAAVSSLVCGPARILIYNDAAARLYGDRHPAALGRPLPEVFPEGWAVVAPFYARAFAGESVAVAAQPLDTRGEGDPGADVFDAFLTPVRDGPTVAQVHMVGIEVGTRARAEAALRESEARQRVLIEGIPQLIWRSRDGGHWIWSSPQWSAFTGLSAEASRGLGWLEALHPDDRQAAAAAWVDADSGGPLMMETRIYNASEGRHGWFATRAAPVRTESGAVIEWLGTSTDIDQLLRLRERQRVLVAELQHRTRNLLGVVRAIADRVIPGEAALAEVRTRFHDRLAALARVNGLLSRLEDSDRIAFDALIRTELAGHGVVVDGRGGRVALEGPRGIPLRSATVQTLALGLHELATNALKYGALSRPEGRLSVSWQVVRSAGGARLRVAWRERGVRVPLGADGEPPRRGYGLELIERALPYQLSAEVAYRLGPDGVDCTIMLPLAPG